MTLDKSSEKTQTLGQAIDELINALTGLNESERRTAIRAASEHLKIRLDWESARALAGPTMPSAPPEIASSETRAVDIRTFKEEKQPSSAMEMAATVAYYLSELAPLSERKSEVEVGDMIKYFKQANFPLPKSPQVLLVNAKNAGYFDSTGGGNYKLNTVGYNLVAHNLPRDGGTRPGAQVPRKRRSSTAKKSTKRKRPAKTKK
jgi:hypothetical protein